MYVVLLVCCLTKLEGVFGGSWDGSEFLADTYRSRFKKVQILLCERFENKHIDEIDDDNIKESDANVSVSGQQVGGG